MRRCPKAVEAGSALFRALESFWHDSEGTAVVEGGVLTPVLFALFFGVYEFSWYFNQQQLIESGLRDAARYMARVSIANPCNAKDSSGTLYTFYAKNLAVYGSASTGTTQRVSRWGTSDVTFACTTYNNAGGNYNGEPTLYFVTASTNFTDPSLGFFGFLGLQPPSISVSHQERSIGPG